MTEENKAELVKAEPKDLEKRESAIQASQPPPAMVSTQPNFRPPDEFDLMPYVKTAGTLQPTKDEIAVLHEKVRGEDIEIRPDGLVYCSWRVYADKLSKAFPMQWAIVPQGRPKMQNDMVAWEFHLFIRGTYMGVAIGQCEYHPNNPTMSYFDAIEGAKSNALTRLCKGIGMNLDLWHRAYIENWKKKYAETYTGKNGRTLWRKKSDSKVDPEEKELKSSFATAFDSKKSAEIDKEIANQDKKKGN